MHTVGVPQPPDLASLFEAEVRAIFGFFVVRCGSREIAEDLTGETFAAASKLFSSGRGAEVTPAWLRTVARRRLIDHWRARTNEGKKSDRLRAIRDPRNAPDVDPDGRVDMALDSMPARQRAALVLRYLDDFSTSEVAEVLDLTYKAAESLLARARTSFANAYQEQEYA